MYKYEISYFDNGILKNCGFGYEEQYRKFLNRLLKNPKRYTGIRRIENWRKVV